MAPNQTFYSAAFPEPARVLGLRLRPFSLGHKILLHRFGSAFVEGGAVSYDDLAISAFVCHHTWEGAVDGLSAPDLDEVMGDWQRRLERPTLAHRLRLRKGRVIDVRAEAERMGAYIGAACQSPDYIYNPEKCGSLSAPIDQVLFSDLITGSGLSMTEILNFPYSLLLHTWITHKAAAGLVRLTDKGSINEALDTAKALHDKLVAEGVIKQPKDKTNGEPQAQD